MFTAIIVGLRLQKSFAHHVFAATWCSFSFFEDGGSFVNVFGSMVVYAGFGWYTLAGRLAG